MFSNLYRGKKVLVTGHTGFKGSWLVQWLLELGAEVTGYSVDVPTEPSLFKVLGHEKKIQHHLGDIRDLEKMKKVFQSSRPEMLFHLAAQALVRDSYENPVATFETNVLGTIHVLECVRATPSLATSLFVATDKCYQNVEWEWGYRENDPLGGKDPYSASKAAAEIAFHSYYRSFFQGQSPQRLASARAGNVIGGGDWAKDRIVPDCVSAWSKAGAPLIRNQNSTRPWQLVLEPLSGYLWLAAQLHQSDAETLKSLNGESFNFGPLPNVTQSVKKLIEEMQKTWPGTTWKQDPEGSGLKKEANLLKLNCDRAYQRLQWEATLDFAESIRMTTEWYRDFYAGSTDMTRVTREQIEKYGQLAHARGQAWAQS